MRTFKWILLFLSLTLSGWGQSLEDEVKELNAIHEKLQREYWDLKQNNLRAREEFKERIDNLDSILKTKYEKQNSLTEELFLVTENLDKAKQRLEETRNINNAFKVLLFETVSAESDNVVTYYPKMIESSTIQLNRIKGVLETDPLKSVDLIIDYKKGLIREGERQEIYRSKLINPATGNAQEVSILRLGFIHSSFVGDQFFGILLREGGLSGITYKWFQELPEGEKNQVENGVAEAFNQAGRSGLVQAPVDVAQAGNRLRHLVEKSEEGILGSVINFFLSGGIVMYPLLLVVLLAFFIITERLMYFWQFRSGKLEFLGKLKKFLQQGNHQEAIAVLKKNGNPFIVGLLLPFLEWKPASRAHAENYLKDQFDIHLPELERGLSGLATLSAVAPLLGLLGTVTGMIELFDVITFYGTGNPKILASGISVALITTQTGLTIAVPLILIHHFFIRWKAKLTDLLDAFAIEIVNICYPLTANKFSNSDQSKEALPVNDQRENLFPFSDSEEQKGGHLSG